MDNSREKARAEHMQEMTRRSKAKREASKAWQEANTVVFEAWPQEDMWALRPAIGRVGGAECVGVELIHLATGYETYHMSPEKAMGALPKMRARAQAREIFCRAHPQVKRSPVDIRQGSLGLKPKDVPCGPYTGSAHVREA